MEAQTTEIVVPNVGMIHDEFGALVHRIITDCEPAALGALKREFHTRLRITLTHPEDSALIEDLWDFFYDWCVFEKGILSDIDTLSPKERSLWKHVSEGSLRAVFLVARANDQGLKVKDLYDGRTYILPRRGKHDFLGLHKGDLLEGRILDNPGGGKRPTYAFVRRPSYHPAAVHAYIKKKVREFRKSEDTSSYQSWLWLLVGMYLKHRIYRHMPVEKIYDDTSRI